MTLAVPAAYLLAALLAGIAIGYLARRRRVSTQGTATLVSLDQLSQSLAGLEQDLRHQARETERERRRADEYFAKIDGCVVEAMGAKSLYVRMGAEHGMAQGMMLTEIESLARQYQALAVEFHTATGRSPRRPQPRMNQTLAVIAAEFDAEHVAPYAPPPPPAPGAPPVSVTA